MNNYSFIPIPILQPNFQNHYSPPPNPFDLNTLYFQTPQIQPFNMFAPVSLYYQPPQNLVNFFVPVIQSYFSYQTVSPPQMNPYTNSKENLQKNYHPQETRVQSDKTSNIFFPVPASTHPPIVSQTSQNKIQSFDEQTWHELISKGLPSEKSPKLIPFSQLNILVKDEGNPDEASIYQSVELMKSDSKIS